MGRRTYSVGVLLAVLGAVVAAFPFVSVWRLTGEVLGEVPTSPKAVVLAQSRELGAE